MVIDQIVRGHFNEVMNREEQLYTKRMSICSTCPLLEVGSWGKVCSNKKYINLKTDKVSTFPCESCVNGCGCRLEAKTRVQEAKCPLSKW